MKATITTNYKPNLNPSHLKRTSRYATYFTGIAAVDGKILEVVRLHTYRTQARCYACIWVMDDTNDIHLTGSGYVGGYGYHMDSAAAAEAISAAGIELSERIAGRGDGALKEAIISIINEIRPEATDIAVSQRNTYS